MFRWINNATPLSVFLTFLLSGFVIYFLSLFNGFVVDDNVQILSNPIIRNLNISSLFFGSSYYAGDFSNTAGIYYKPIFTLLTSILFNLSGGTPFLMHLAQLLLHTTNSFLVYILFSKFFKKFLSIFLAFIFLVHPGNTESVVYISNLQDVLFPFFGLMAIIIWDFKCKFECKLVIVGVFLLLSILSKESGILFLLTIPLYVLICDKQKIWKSVLVSISVFIIYFVLRLFIAKVPINHQIISPIMSLSLEERLMTLPKVIFSFLKLFVFPLNLSWGQHWVVKSFDLTEFWIPLLYVIGFCIFVLFIYFKTSIKQHYKILFFITIALLGLGLHSQIIPLDFTFAERWIYFPMIGLLGLLCYLVSVLRVEKLNKSLILLVTVLLILVLSYRSMIRSLDWKNDKTLVIHDIKIDPNSLSLQNNYAYLMMQEKNYKVAIPYLEKSLATFKDTSSYNNLAFSYAKVGEKENSLATYEKALKLGDFYMTYQNYIAELIRQEKLEKASELTKKAIEKFPNNNKLWLLASVIEYKKGNLKDAIILLQNADQLIPGSANLLYQKMQNKENIDL